MHAGVYLRISQDRDGTEEGVGRQRQLALDLCQQRGWTPVEFCDNDISAFSGKLRPRYQALMAAIDAGEITRVVVYHPSRIWRSRKERADGIARMQAAKAALTCIRGPELDMSSAYGRGMAGLVGEFDTLESEVKSERQRDACRQKIVKGLPTGGPRPFGFEPDGIAHRPTEAQALRAAYASLLAGDSLGSICRRLNDAGNLTPKGNPWGHGPLKTLLLNPRNAGIRAVFRDTRTRKERDELGRAAWEAIVSESVFRSAVAILTAEERRSRTGNVRKYLLAGLARCGVCDDGTPVITAFRKPDSAEQTVRTYRCKSSKHLSRLAAPIDDYIERIVFERMSRADAADLLVDRSRPDAEALRTEAIALEGQLKELGREMGKRRTGMAAFLAAVDETEQQLADVRSQMASVETAPILAPLVHVGDREAVRKAWRGLTLDRQRAAVDVLMTVTVLRGHPGRPGFDPNTVRIDPRNA